MIDDEIEGVNEKIWIRMHLRELVEEQRGVLEPLE
jgi:hypothetical protein